MCAFEIDHHVLRYFQINDGRTILPSHDEPTQKFATKPTETPNNLATINFPFALHILYTGW